MSLPPLANVVALASPDPQELDAARAAIEADVGFDAPWSPAPGCLVAVSRLPRSSPDGDAVHRSGLAFVEGHEEVATSGRSWEDVAQLAAQRPNDLAELPGDFGFLHVGPDGAATVVRSAGGLVPFYLTGAGDRWTVASTLALMVRFGPARLRLDPLVSAIWTSGWDAAPGRRTFFEGVLGLARGEYARLGATGPAFGRYWDPRRGVTPGPAPDHPERLRAALVRTLERDLDPTGGNLLALSGGIDSSALGALGAGVLEREVSALIVLPVDESARGRDLHYIDALDTAVGFRSRIEVVLDAERRLALLDEPNVPFQVPHPVLCLLPGVAREQPVSVLFGGEFADQVVGSTQLLDDWARHTTPAALWRGRRALPTGRRDVARWVRYRQRRLVRRPRVAWPADLPELVRGELRAEYRQWLRDRRVALAGDAGPLPSLAMQLERQGFLGMHWEVASSLGIRRSFPFVSREALELAFECHPSELVGPGSKRLLRAALRDDVPDLNLNRPDKGTAPTPADQPASRWQGEIPSELESVLKPGWPPPEEVPYWDLLRLRQLVALAHGIESARSSSGAGAPR